MYLDAISDLREILDTGRTVPTRDPVHGYAGMARHNIFGKIAPSGTGNTRNENDMKCTHMILIFICLGVEPFKKLERAVGRLELGRVAQGRILLDFVPPLFVHLSPPQA